jgi:integrase
MLIESDANIKDVHQRLGHSRLSTTMDTYAHVTPKMKLETVDIFEKVIKSN